MSICDFMFGGTCKCFRALVEDLGDAEACAFSDTDGVAEAVVAGSSYDGE